MKLPLQIVFRNMKRSPSIEEHVRERAEKLDLVCHDITSCRVVIELPHRHHAQGNMFAVRIDITVPNKEIVVNREPTKHLANEELNVALRDAFDSATRQLEDYLRRRRHQVKTHLEAPSGSISQLHEDYGFIATEDEREIYFHSHSLIGNGFDRLRVGTKVTFTEEEGDKGPQVSTLRVVKHGDETLQLPIISEQEHLPLTAEKN